MDNACKRNGIRLGSCEEDWGGRVCVENAIIIHLESLWEKKTEATV